MKDRNQNTRLNVKMKCVKKNEDNTTITSEMGLQYFHYDIIFPIFQKD